MSTTAHRPADPVPVQRAPRLGLILAVVCLGQFMVILDSSIVNVALPVLENDLGFTAASLPWAVNAYVLTFGGLLLLGGRATDLAGRRRVFLTGTAVFAVASLACGLAQTPAHLIIARALQGAGAAAVAPATLAVVFAVFRAGPARAKALGAYGTVGAVASATGIVLGGLLTDLVSWRAVFLVNVPVGVLTLVVAPRILPPDPSGALRSDDPSERSRLDVRGAVLITSAVTALLLAVVTGAEDGVTPEVAAYAVGACLLLAGFVVTEHRHPDPLVPLRVLSLPTVATANVVMLLGAGASLAALYLTALALQRVHGATPTEAGLQLLLFPVASFAGVQATTRLLPGLGARVLLVTGLLLLATGIFALSRTPAGAPYLTGMAPALALFAVGFAVTLITLYAIAGTGVPDDQAGLASGLINTSQQVGAAVGVAVLAALAASLTPAGPTPDDLRHGYGIALIAAAGLAAIAAAGALLVPRRRPTSTTPHPF